MHRFWALLFCLACSAIHGTAVTWLDEQFELPTGFRIYRAAAPELTGGSYAMTIDGQGRLLIGDGTAVRRLIDRDQDGVFERFETIATGLGPRGPQGLLVYGDDLYAVGGDGLQLFTGYRSGNNLVQAGRLGAKLNTGGDHDTHTILRGLDGYLYLMAGNGAGIKERTHITEASSPALFEREASVFRISPDGAHWECLASGGRNPPSLGVNDLGEFFSFDSDMEWHVGLPFYRPTRLNHWLVGGDQGWEEVGALRSYFIDNLPGVLEVGRGSPNWGVVYQHTQLPAKYHEAFLVCDYRWKQESNDQYATSGRLVAFLLRRQGATWTATMETLAKPKAGARDADGRPINFALIDVAVAPDGSLFLSDHNQGIWRLCHVPGTPHHARPPPMVPTPPEIPKAGERILEMLLTLPQPGSEWSRLQAQALIAELTNTTVRWLEHAPMDDKRPLSQRLRALRLLAPDFARLPRDLLNVLAKDSAEEIRGQAAWLLGLRNNDEEIPQLRRLLADPAPFVRRRAAEALTRSTSSVANAALLERLSEPDRMVRYAAMVALSHRQVAEWFENAANQPSLQTRLRALTAAALRREAPPTERTSLLLRQLAQEPLRSTEDKLDWLRVLDLYQSTVNSNGVLRETIARRLLQSFPDPDPNVRWEQTRLLGHFRVNAAFPALLRALQSEADPVTQFHLATSLSALSSGWSEAEEKAAVKWMLETQKGWFTEFGGKGVQFPEFWGTVLSEFGSHHREALLRELGQIDLAGQLGMVLLNLLAQRTNAGPEFIRLYTAHQEPPVRLRILAAMRPFTGPEVAAFLQAEHDQLNADAPQGAAMLGMIFQNWALHPDETTLPYLLYEGLFHNTAPVVRTSAAALLKNEAFLRHLLGVGGVPAKTPTTPGTSQADLAADLIQRIIERPDLLQPLENILVVWSGQPRAGFQPGVDLQRKPVGNTHQTAVAHWQRWYSQRFAKNFDPPAAKAAPIKTDSEIHGFILGEDFRAGNTRQGAVIYEALQCHTCHGGGAQPGREGRLFGPDLAGVTRRLSRAELADSLVYPSKQVADRFKATEVTLQDGTVLTGFVTEQTAESVTLAERDQIRRLSRSSVRSMSPMAASLMPERLLNHLTWEELRDLLSFLEKGKP
jgi:putative heme-binding domain-containing protein